MKKKVVDIKLYINDDSSLLASMLATGVMESPFHLNLSSHGWMNRPDFLSGSPRHSDATSNMFVGAYCTVGVHSSRYMPLLYCWWIAGRFIPWTRDIPIWRRERGREKERVSLRIYVNLLRSIRVSDGAIGIFDTILLFSVCRNRFV